MLAAATAALMAIQERGDKETFTEGELEVSLFQIATSPDQIPSQQKGLQNPAPPSKVKKAAF